MRSIVRKSLFNALIVGAASTTALATLQAGCSSSGTSPSSGGPAAGNGVPGTTSDDGMGIVGMQLTLPGGAQLDTVTWTITGPNGASTVFRSDSVDVSNSQSISFNIGGIPAGAGYKITLTGTSVDGATTCSGSAVFTTTARTTTNVSVALQCSTAAADAGSAQVTATTYACGTWNSTSASPTETSVGHAVSLTASATGPNPGALTYAWSAPSGTFDAANAASAHFTCTAPGAVTITLTVGDGPVPAGASCDPSASTTTLQVQCDGSTSGVVTAAALVPGSTTDPVVNAGYYQGAVVCGDANDNGRCDASEAQASTDASGHFTLIGGTGPVIADVGTSAVNTASGAHPASRNVFRISADQIAEQSGGVVLSAQSSEILRAMEANGTTYAVEKANLAQRLSAASTLTGAQVVADVNTLSGSAKSTVAREANVLAGRFAYAITKLDRGDLYPDALAVPGGDPELTGMAGVTAATATTADSRHTVTFHEAEQAAFAVEAIPRYDHIFIVMLENKATEAILGSAYAPKINAYVAAGNFASSYYATGNPSEPNYTALGGGDDFGITDDAQWNCDATGANAVTDSFIPSADQPGLASSPFTKTCTQSIGTNHNIVGKANLFNAVSAAGLTWRTYSESMNPGQDFRIDSVADPAVVVPDHVYAPGTVAGNAAQIGSSTLNLPMPAGLYKTKHHPGMAYQNVRSAPEFNFSNRTLGGGQWDGQLSSSTKYAIPAGYDVDQFGTDLNTGNVGNLNFVIPDQCDDMHGITVQGTDTATGTTKTASDCSSVANNVPTATGGNILARGDAYVDQLVKKIQASPVWQNQAKKVAIVLMFDEGNATTGFNSCCGWKAGQSVTNNPLIQNSDGTWSPDTSNPNYNKGNKGHGKSIYVVLNNQPAAPKGVVDNDAYSHFSFVRTLQDMFAVSDPTKDASFMNRSKYTEKFVAQNILNLPEFTGSADTHFDSVRPMNHAYVIPASYTEKATADDTRALQVGPDATQTSIWATK